MCSQSKFTMLDNNGYVIRTIGSESPIPEQIKDESGKVVTATLNAVCAMP